MPTRTVRTDEFSALDETGHTDQAKPVTVEPPRGATPLARNEVAGSRTPAKPEQLVMRFVDTALRRAFTERLPDGSWYAEIKVLPGVWAQGATEDDALRELRTVLEDWVALKLRMRHRDFPVLGGVDLNRI